MSLKKIPWHAVFIVLYPIVFLYAENMQHVQLSDVWSPLIKVVAGAIGLFLLLLLAFRNGTKAAILFTVMVFLFFHYRQYYSALYPGVIPLIKVRFDHNFYKWFSLCLSLLVTWRLIKSKSDFSKVTRLFNFFTIILIGFSFVKIATFIRAESKINLPKKTVSTGSETVLQPNGDPPSIFYLIVDAYGREDILNSLFDHDNSAFTDFLEEEDFYVADKSFANYNQTVLSLPSAMNMTYLDSFADVVGRDYRSRTPLKLLIHNNTLVANLEEIGYTSIGFDAAIYDDVQLDSVDVFMETGVERINLFESELVNSTIITAFNRNYGEPQNEDDRYTLHRRKILNAFDNIQELTKEEGPLYVHGHVLSPHQPFVFDENGNSVTPKHEYTIWRPIQAGRDPKEYKVEYIQQLKFINKKLTETVKAIKANNKNAIIIIQGDHGPCSELNDIDHFENNNFAERMPILNAYYFPDHDYSMLSKDISPVNSYRVIYNKYFGKNMPLLPNRSYYATWMYPYQFRDVTDSLPQ
jgi:hypothetical protein|tara:strand:+ start:2895 stop:4463 length:1569 start_codon:yes stop_codon:yes gene_type:complete